MGFFGLGFNASKSGLERGCALTLILLGLILLGNFEVTLLLANDEREPGSSHSKEAGERVLDLGKTPVTGALRKPSIYWIESQQKVRKKIPELLKSEYARFISKLLAPEPWELKDSDAAANTQPRSSAPSNSIQERGDTRTSKEYPTP